MDFNIGKRVFTMKRQSRIKWLAALFFILCLGLTDTGSADESDNVPGDELNSVLQGFDSPGPEDQGLSDVLGGFEDDPVAETKTIEAQSGPDFFHISGSAGIAGAVNLVSFHRPPDTKNRKGIAKLRGELDLTADLNLGGTWRARVAGQSFYDTAFTLNDRDNYTTETLDEYEKEAELGEAWLQGTLLPGLDIKTGRQIVVWGKSDNIRVTDILNPMDKREPGMTDIEDLRLPVAMTRLDYSLGAFIFTGIVIHENTIDKWPVYGSDYYVSSSRLPEEEEPSDFTLDNQEFAFSVNAVFSGWEASLYAARVFDDTAHVQVDSQGRYKRVHSRINMLGAAINLVRGNWLYKTEAAFLSGLEYAALPGEDKSRIDILAGVEYSGFTDTTIGFEAANRHIYGFDHKIKAAPDSAEQDDFQWALRVSRDFFHERLETVFIAQAYDPLGQDGALERLECTYDLTDDWEATLGLVLYQSGDKPAFKDLNECNRLFFKVHYSF